MLRKIVLHGDLPEKLGVSEFNLDIDTLDMLVKGMKCVVPGFREYALERPNFEVIAEGTEQCMEEPNPNFNFQHCEKIHIVPTIEGEFDPATWTAFAAFITSDTIAAIFARIGISIAVSMVLNGIAQSLAKKPSTQQNAQANSFIFNSPVNATSQGGAVPIAYGTSMVGSTVIAANLQIVQIAV